MKNFLRSLIYMIVLIFLISCSKDIQYVTSKTNLTDNEGMPVFDAADTSYLIYKNDQVSINLDVVDGKIIWDRDIILQNTAQIEFVRNHIREYYEKGNDVINTRGNFVPFVYAWPDNHMPYQFHSEVSQQDRDDVIDAIREINDSNDHFRIVPRTNESDYALIRNTNGGGCRSGVGFGFGGVLEIFTADCSHSTTLHELLHGVGMFHEQKRSDRDDYIIVNWDNIPENAKHNYWKIGPNDVINYGDLDFNSIMMYPSVYYAAGNDNNEGYAMTKLDGSTWSTGGSDLTDLDMETLEYTNPPISVVSNIAGPSQLNCGTHIYTFQSASYGGDKSYRNFYQRWYKRNVPECGAGPCPEPWELVGYGEEVSLEISTQTSGGSGGPGGPSGSGEEPNIQIKIENYLDLTNDLKDSKIITLSRSACN